MKLTSKMRLLATAGAAVGMLSLGLIAPAVSGATMASSTLTFAEGPGAQPNYIFPYMSCNYFSVDNINQFQSLMYRPLYWFGLGASSAVVDTKQAGAEAADGLSLAAAPKFSNGNHTVIIHMGNYKFADGQAVDANSVKFFLNMYKAAPTDYCGYNAGYGIPDQVSSVTTAGDNTVYINFKSSVNPNWILYNYLSEITPMPTKWAGSNTACVTGAWGAASTTTACNAVLKNLLYVAKNYKTYTGPLWQAGVDGPYKLTSFDSLGNVTFVPNPTYMGPQKSQVAVVKEVPFTSGAAEMNALRAGSIDLGYADTTYLTSPAPAPGKVGPNWAPISGRYKLVTGTSWAFSYAAYNFNSKSPEAKFLDQLYIRQALQDGVNQVGIINKIDKGYGLVNVSPLPANTPTSIAAPLPADPYPYNLSKAASLLSSHGWTKVSNQLTCTSPGTGAGHCGAGISQGDVLTIHFLYGSGQQSFTDEVQTIVSAWDSLGIAATSVGKPFNEVISDCAGGSAVWSVCDWGAGWIYAPDYYPSGEWAFVPGASFNIGAYVDPHMTTLIKATTFGTAPLTAYGAYAEQQLPVMYQPNGEGTGEVINTLKSTIGFTPNPLQNFNPEYFHF